MTASTQAALYPVRFMPPVRRPFYQKSHHPKDQKYSNLQTMV